MNMKLLLEWIFVIFSFEIIFIECSCNRPDTSDVVHMCYGTQRVGTQLYLETNLTSTTTVSQCSCTLTANAAGTSPVQINFNPNQLPVSCYYETTITYERSQATFSCIRGSPATFFDVVSGQDIQIDLKELFKIGSKETRTCIQITSQAGVQMELTCAQVADNNVSPISTTTKQATTLSSTTVKPTTTTVKPTTTTVKPTTTTVKPTTTTVKPTTTTVKPTTTTVKQTTTTVTPTTTTVTPPTTTVKPTTSTANPTTSIVNPITTTVKPTTTTVNPTTTTVNPTTTTVNPTTTLANPSTTIVNHTTTTVKQSTIIVNPATTTVLTTRQQTTKKSTASEQSLSASTIDPQRIPGIVTKPDNSDLIVPIGVGVGSFLLLVALITVILCNKYREPSGEDSALIESGDQSNQGKDTVDGIFAPNFSNAKTEDTDNDDVNRDQNVGDQPTDQQAPTPPPVLTVDY